MALPPVWNVTIGTPVGEKPSRSNPVRQPTTAQEAVSDLHELLSVASEPTPYVMVPP
jgi:hypothetical protein